MFQAMGPEGLKNLVRKAVSRAGSQGCLNVSEKELGPVFSYKQPGKKLKSAGRNEALEEHHCSQIPFCLPVKA